MVRYVPHANKALRSFNMYLNVRTPPPKAPWPLSLALPAQNSDITPPVQHITRGRSEASPRGNGRRVTTIPPIPPSTNPRGELIFTSRVDKNFRESYERYRDAFERRRNERALAEASMSMWARVWQWPPGGHTKNVVKRDFNVEKDAASRTPSRSVTPIEQSARAPS